MKKLLYLFVILLSYNLSSQDVLDLALIDKTKIVNKEGYKPNLKTDKWNINNYLYELNESKLILNDSMILIELISKSTTQNLMEWNVDELNEVYLTKKNQKIIINTALEAIKPKSKEQQRELKRKIRQYNNNPNKWRGWPLSISRPIFSDDNKYSIISFKFGNNGGYSSLYQNLNEEWKLIGVFNRFAY
ncbi:hypothetical protein D1816_02530 [Aquimarina sp. AD10]|uniref:hypothetical protein n=1 Tax=Aquimarina sp. AD10 TaxID=1714849 RepID=UPI000E542B92|nr:hypothetical protein [Aquimarina sp. AD10]AXT59269.1 hypothetical protein D1816_02530 [Aquimarina sp. AD10]RKM92445.1 hypothetical protein D7033_20990 [Aquimarina sp. AD10]